MLYHGSRKWCRACFSLGEERLQKIPDRREVTGMWQRAYARWCMLRKKVVAVANEFLAGAKMAGHVLHEFDCDLCDYILGQIRPYLGMLSERPRAVPKLNYAEWHDLDLPTWIGRAVAALPIPLANHVWAGVFDERKQQPLNDEGLSALELALDDAPMRLEAACVWTPFPALHRRSVNCVREIQFELTRATAEGWAEDSARFSSQLEEDGLTVSSGIAIVREWLWCVRRLLEAMSATEFLPTSVENHVPTRQSKGVRQTKGQTTGEVSTPEMLSPSMIAIRFGISRSTVYIASRAGQLPHYRVPARKGARGKYLFREADVIAWLESLSGPFHK